MLSSDQVVKMRRLYAMGNTTQAELGAMFGIDAGQVSRIVRGKAQKSAGGPLVLRQEAKKDEDWYKVNSETGCWIWQGRFNPGGYGVHATGYDQ